MSLNSTLEPVAVSTEVFVGNFTTDYPGYEEYIYDYDEAVSYVDLGEVVPVALVYGLTLLLGVVGNSLVIFSILRYKPMRSITNIFLLSLASADLLLVLICVPVKCVAFFTFTWDLGIEMCKFVHYMQNVSMICSVMTLTVMSVERFIAILFPLQAKSLCTPKHAVLLCVLIWLTSYVLAIPIIFGQIEITVGVRRKGKWCVKRWEKPIYDRLYEMFMLVLLFIIPVLIMVIAYAAICRELWIVTIHRAQLRASSHSSPTYYHQSGYTVAPVNRSHFGKQKATRVSKEDDNTRRQVIQMLVVVVVLFAICWGPILINNVLTAWEVLPKLHYGFLKPMRQAFFLMSYMNSCVNPIVYGFMSKNFRDKFKHAICKACCHYDKVSNCCRKRKQPERSTPRPLATKSSVSRTISSKTDIDTYQTDCISDTIRRMPPFENSSDTT